MKLAAARAIAGVIPEAELGPEYIVPSVFNRAVAPAVADAVAAAAIESGIARRDRASRRRRRPGLDSHADRQRREPDHAAQEQRGAEAENHETRRPA